MKKHLFLVAAFATLSLIGFTPRVQAQEENISFQVFYDALTPYGEWLNVEGYGYCWRPSVDEDWTPYTDGNWAYTDYGWTWCGNEEWSWAPYHYGRWTQLQNLGWVWVPGYEWAPAWVSWRYGDEYVGWAPLPPTAVWVADVGFNTTIDVECGITPSYYSFCPIQYFGAPQLRPCIQPYWNNAAIINRTRNVTRIARNGNSMFVYSGGPNLAEVNQRVEHPFQQLRLEPQRNVDPRRLIAGQGRNHVQNNVLQVVAPSVVNATARPQNVAAEIPRQQVVRPVDRISPRHQGNPGANPVPAQNEVPPTAVYPPQQEAPSQPYNQGNQNAQEHFDRPGRPTRPHQTPVAVATPTPKNSGSYQLPNATPVNPAPVAVSGTTTHRLVPYTRPQTQQEGNVPPVAPSPQTQQVLPAEEQARRVRAARQQAAQQQATQQQATQQQATQQQATQQQAAQQQAAQQQAAQQQAAQQQAAQQQAAQQATQQRTRQQQPQQQFQPQQPPQQVPQQPQGQFVPAGGNSHGGDGHHKDR